MRLSTQAHELFCIRYMVLSRTMITTYSVADQVDLVVIFSMSDFVGRLSFIHSPPPAPQDFDHRRLYSRQIKC